MDSFRFVLAIIDVVLMASSGVTQYTPSSSNYMGCLPINGDGSGLNNGLTLAMANAVTNKYPVSRSPYKNSVGDYVVYPTDPYRSIATCLDICKTNGFPYAADHCACGSTFQYGFVSNSLCNLKCSGNLAEICGGGSNGITSFSGSVYSTVWKILNRNQLASWVPSFLNQTTIVLNNQAIASIDTRTFSGLSHIITLKLNTNFIKLIDSYVFNDLVNLRELNLNGNSLSFIDLYTFSTLKNLVTLDLSWNQLTSLDSTTFNELTSLHTLFLNNNQLTRIEPSVFSRMTQIAFIHLNKNNLVAIDRLSFLGLTNLEVVYLKDNPIITTHQNLVIQLCLTNPKCVICLFDTCNLKNDNE